MILYYCVAAVALEALSPLTASIEGGALVTGLVYVIVASVAQSVASAVAQMMWPGGDRMGVLLGSSAVLSFLAVALSWWSLAAD